MYVSMAKRKQKQLCMFCVTGYNGDHISVDEATRTEDKNLKAKGHLLDTS
jgi:hypothetical protein